MTVIPHLFPSTPTPLPFDRSFEIRAFLLERDQGNLLVYNIGALEPDAKAFEAVGGIWRQYLNHWHEALLGCDWVRNTFDAPLFCHEMDQPLVPDGCVVDETFPERQILDHDFEVIPTPGHTPGATAFLWDSGQQRCLFTSDTIYLRQGEWVAAVLESSDRDQYIESLELIRELDFDVLIPWAATSGQPYQAPTNRADAERRIDSILQRLRQGQNH